MLSLSPPFLTLGDVMVFRDDVDPESFYYICQRPSLARDNDGKPVISVYCVLPESGVRSEDDILEAGLNLDVDLSVSDEELKEVKKLIQKSFGVTPKRLSNAPLHDGKVQFCMAQSNANSDSSWFVTSGVSPSMVGSNRVSLCVRASGKDAETLMAAAVEGVVPACVYYSLNLIGVSPVYHARMHANMETIYQRVQETSSVNAIFTSVSVDRILSDLESSKMLTVEIEETDPDIRSEAMSSLMSELRSKVIDAFFQPVPLEKNETSVGDKATQVIHSIIGGGYSMKKSINQRVLSEFTIDLSQKNAKLYGFYPQSQLDSMIQEAGVNMAEEVKWIRVDDLPYFEQVVNLRTAAEAFQEASIEGVQLECRVVDTDTGAEVYNQTQPPIPLFDRENNSYDFYFRRERKRNLAFEYRTTMYLRGVTTLLPGVIKSDWCRTDNPFIYVNPGNLLNQFKVELMLDDLAVFKTASQIMAMVEVVTYPEKAIVLSATPIMFSEANANSQFVSLLAGKDNDLRYNIELIYYLSGKNLSFRYEGFDSPVFVIPNPFEKQWTVDLKTHCNWDEISKVYLHTRYLDVEQDRWIEHEFQFTEGIPSGSLVAQCGPETPSRIFEYSVYVDYVNGDYAEAGWYHHKGSPSLHLYGDRIVSEQLVRIRVKNPEAIHAPQVKTADLVLVKDGVEDKVPITGAEIEYPCRPNLEGYLYYISIKKKDNRPFKTDKYPIESEDIEIEFPVRI